MECYLLDLRFPSLARYPHFDRLVHLAGVHDYADDLPVHVDFRSLLPLVLVQDGAGAVLQVLCRDLVGQRFLQMEVRLR